jgi:hypothetical protein
MQGPHQKELRIFKIETLPGLQKMVYAFPFDQGSDKAKTKDVRGIPRLIALNIDPSCHITETII